MKKAILTFGLLLSILFCYSQEYVSMYVPGAAEAQFAKNQAQKVYFNQYKSKAFNCYDIKDYDGCIYYYKLGKKTKWYNGDFTYYAGMSYYYLGKNGKAKSTLKKATRQGCYLAVQAINKYFK